MPLCHLSQYYFTAVYRHYIHAPRTLPVSSVHLAHHYNLASHKSGAYYKKRPWLNSNPKQHRLKHPKPTVIAVDSPIVLAKIGYATKLRAPSHPTVERHNDHHHPTALTYGYSSQ